MSVSENKCCAAFKRAYEICICHNGKQDKDEYSWQKNVKTLTITEQPLKTEGKIWTTNYNATFLTAETTSNEKKQEKSCQWAIQPPNGTIYPYFPQPEIDQITTATNDQLFHEPTDKAAQDAWYFSGIFTQEALHKYKEATEL